jgi:hypothetical protein
MGLLDRLTKQGGTNLSPYDGTTPKVNPGATKQSKLHAFNNTPGYSLNGNYTPEVNTAYTEYDDGYTNALPQPSQLDRNGNIPANQKYLNNLPK